VWFVTHAFHREGADEARANVAFSAARARFNGTTPLFELRPGGPALTRAVPQAGSQPNLRTMHVLHWSAGERTLTTFDLPFALLRFRDSPLDVVKFINAPGGSDPVQQKVVIRVSDIERFGPALLMDQELEDGHHVLIWTE